MISLCFQEYNDTLLMTYLAMFTNCSRYASISLWNLLIRKNISYTTKYDKELKSPQPDVVHILYIVFLYVLKS
jgi:hypothetical protein